MAEAKAGKNGPEGPESVAELLWARQLGGCEGAKPKSWRVIIRNLAFKATDEDIRSACAKAGFAWDLTVPRDFHRKPKGFAFAAFTSKADAARAVAEVNDRHRRATGGGRLGALQALLCRGAAKSGGEGGRGGK